MNAISSTCVSPTRVQQLDAATARAEAGALCELLVDCVNGGASVGFMAPVLPATARAFSISSTSVTSSRSSMTRERCSRMAARAASGSRRLSARTMAACSSMGGL